MEHQALCSSAEPLSLAHQAAVESLLTALRSPLSEYAFANLYLFRRVHQYHYLPGALPCIAGVTYDGIRHLLPLFDLATVEVALLRERLLGYDCFYPVSHCVLARLDAGLWMVEERAADADYRYPCANFLSYPGKRLAKKRNQVSQLARLGQPSSAPFTVLQQGAAHRLLQTWLSRKAGSAAETDFAPCLDAIEHADQLGLHGWMHYWDGQPLAFVLAETLADDSVAIHFAKGRDDLPGVYPWMFQHFCKMAGGRWAWINFEQDLGLERFRRAKQAYQPTELLRKFRLTPIPR